MLASATEVEVELHVPDDGPTFFGVTWAQDPRDNKVFIKAFPQASDGRRGLLESTGLVEEGDCLTAINGISLDRSSPLHEVMANIRSATSPLTLRFARYPPSLKLAKNSSSSGSLSSVATGGSFSRSGSSRNIGLGGVDGGGGAGSPSDRNGGVTTNNDGQVAGAGGEGGCIVEDSDLDAVLNSALVLGLGERVAGIQQRNARLLQAVDRIGQAAATKRAGVEGVASSAAALTAAGGALPHALRALSAIREDVSALCETMARLDESLAARERAAASRRRMNEGAGPIPPGGLGGALGGASVG